MSQSALGTHIARIRKYQELQSTLFHLNRPAALDIVDAAEPILHAYARIKELCFSSKVTLKEGVELEDLLERLVGNLKSMTRQYDECRNEIEALKQLGMTGAKLIKSDSFFTNLTEGFSLTGSRETVHDDHFVRRNLYWLDPASLKKFDDAICQLLMYGRIEPLQLTAESSPERQFDSLQRICICYGMAMSQTVASSVFVDVPDIWQGLIGDCETMNKNAKIAQNLVKSDMQQDLELAMVDLHTLVADETRKGGEFIRFESVLCAKSGIKSLRAVIENLSTLFTTRPAA